MAFVAKVKTNIVKKLRVQFPHIAKICLHGLFIHYVGLPGLRVGKLIVCPLRPVLYATLTIYKCTGPVFQWTRCARCTRRP